jgi:hypothetical protein
MLDNRLVEDTTTPNAPNVATTDENLSVDQMFQQGSLPSLGRQIFSVVPMNGPTAALFNIAKHPTENKFQLLRNEVEVFPSESINTSLTKEVVQDIMSQYGREAKYIIGRLLNGLSNDQENARTFEFLNANSKVEADLQLSNSLVSETNLFEIGQRVNELILKANNKNLRTYESYCVLPYYAGGAISALGSYVGAVDDQERGLFITKIGQISYYLNPVADSSTAYVGLVDSANPSKSCAVFSPYRSNVVEATDPNTGESFYHIYNRFAITKSPLHVTGNEMMFKFEVLQ